MWVLSSPVTDRNRPQNRIGSARVVTIEDWLTSSLSSSCWQPECQTWAFCCTELRNFGHCDNASPAGLVTCSLGSSNKRLWLFATFKIAQSPAGVFNQPAGHAVLRGALAYDGAKTNRVVTYNPGSHLIFPPCSKLKASFSWLQIFPPPPPTKKQTKITQSRSFIKGQSRLPINKELFYKFRC